jgi:hypothetical protein
LLAGVGSGESGVSFALHYRQHVLPQLALLAKGRAHYVVADAETFVEAYGVLEARARELGALLLPPNLVGDLEDWIASTLLLEVQGLEAIMFRVETRMARQWGAGAI